MTAYEWWDLGHTALGHVLTNTSIMFAIFSGYLVAAFTVGSKLTASQVWIANSAYTVVMLFQASACYSLARGSIMNYQEALRLAGVDRPSLPHYDIAFVLLILFLWIISLKVMLDLRRAEA